MQYSLFGSILTFGAMLGAITSGPIADFLGRKGVSSGKLLCFCLGLPSSDAKRLILEHLQAMRVSSAFCVGGWLAIYFSKVLTTELSTMFFHNYCPKITHKNFFFSLQGPVPLDIGRLATGYGMGVFSYVVGYSSTLQNTT